MYDIITIGDTTVDVFLQLDETSSLCRLDKKTNTLSLAYASKIPVHSVEKIVGVGNAANHAVGASRLGLKTGIYTIIGDDHSGHAIIHNFKKEKISKAYVQVDKTQQTNYSTVIDYKGDRTILVFHEQRTYQLPRLAKTKWIFFSSICGNHTSFHKQLQAHIKQTGTKLGFNPGSHQMRLGSRALAPILSMTDVLFVNKSEAQRLTTETEDIRILAKALYRKGPKIVVITDGKKGSYCFDGQTFYHLGILGLPVVERTGCGDAYASGFLAAVQYGRSLPEAMRWGTANAGSAATKMGSQLGLLTKSHMTRILQQHKTFQPKVV